MTTPNQRAPSSAENAGDEARPYPFGHAANDAPTLPVEIPRTPTPSPNVRSTDAELRLSGARCVIGSG